LVAIVASGAIRFENFTQALYLVKEALAGALTFFTVKVVLLITALL